MRYWVSPSILQFRGDNSLQPGLADTSRSLFSRTYEIKSLFIRLRLFVVFRVYRFCARLHRRRRSDHDESSVDDRILGHDLDITNVQAKPDEASAYFMMASKSTKLNVSVFIEPVDKCKTGEECRDHVLNLGNPSWGKFEQLAKGKIKDFSYFEFYRPEVKGLPLKMLDMHAQYVSGGYWVDLHISKALYTKADHALFEKLINSVEFVPRKDAGRIHLLMRSVAKETPQPPRGSAFGTRPNARRAMPRFHLQLVKMSAKRRRSDTLSDHPGPWCQAFQKADRCRVCPFTARKDRPAPGCPCIPQHICPTSRLSSSSWR